MVSALAQKKQLRQDPTHRPTHGWTPSWHRLVGRDPGLFYTYVSKSSEDFGVEYYESLGYHVVKYKEHGGITLGTLTRDPGKPITFRGQVLMACTHERKAEIEREGPDGGSGAELNEQIAAQITNRKLVPSGVRAPGYIAVDRDLTNEMNPTENADVG